MSEAEGDREIIELTEVVEEGPGLRRDIPVRDEGRGARDEGKEPLFPSSPGPLIRDEGRGTGDEGREPKTPSLGEPVVGDEGRGARDGEKEPEVPLFRSAEDEGEESKSPFQQTLQQTLMARVEGWLALEGTAALERIAREMFPRIAQEILRQEIEKLKAEAEAEAKAEEIE